MNFDEIFSIFVMRHLCLPYRWGGDDPALGFDCSGLTQEWLKTSLINFPKNDFNAQGLHDWFVVNPEKFLEFNGDPIKKADLLFFGISPKLISHVALALNSKFMLEAGSGDKTTVNLEVAIKQNAFVRIRPILHRKDYVGHVTPKYEV